MADEQLKVFVDVVTNRAVSELKKLKKATEDTGEELEDTRTEAQKVADQIDKVTESMVADMKAAEKAADALAQALGPEMAGKIGQAGIDEFVSDLKRAGLSAKDVEADADRLAQTLKNIDQAKAPIRDVQTHIKKVGVETDNSRSVFANFTGNALSELPIVSGAFGPLNTAIGQFGEYAVDGNIKLDKFIGTAAGLGAAALATSLIVDAFASAADQARRADERARGLAEGISDIVDELYNLDELSKGGVIDPLSQALTTGDEDAVKLVEALGAVGLAASDAAGVITSLRDDPLKAMDDLAKKMGLPRDMALKLAKAVNESDRQLQDIAEYDGNETLADQFRRAAEAAGYTEEEYTRLYNTFEQLQDSAENTNLDSVYRQFLNLQVAAGGLKAELVDQAEAMAGVARDTNPQKVYEQYLLLAKGERELADEAAAAEQRMKDLKSELGRLSLKADATKLSLEQMLNVLTNEQTFNDIQLNLLGMKDRLDDLKREYETGKITAEEYWLGTRQEILGAQTDLGSYLTDLGGIPAELITQIVTSFDPNNVNATIDTIEELIRRGLTINGRPFGASELVGPGGSSMTPTNPTDQTDPRGTGNNPAGTTVIVNGALDPVAVADQIDRILRENGYRNGTG